MTPMPGTVEPFTEQARSSGGTLASRPAPPIHEAPPQIEMAPTPSGFRSRDGGDRRGIAPIVVVALVTGALLAGFLLGFAVARSM
jgi:hypothetical protein